MQSINDLMRSRIRFIAIVLAAFFLYLICRLYWVQVVRHEHYYTQARAKYITTKTTAGQRGEIFDFHGNLLVGNMPCQEITVTPCNIKAKNDRQIAMIMAQVLNIKFHEILPKISSKTRKVVGKDGKITERPRQYALIARNVPLLIGRRLEQILKERGLDGGVHFKDVTIRYYPKGNLLANVLGVTSIDRDKAVALMGLEKFFDRDIRSSSGEKIYERTRDGRQIGANALAEVHSRDGMDIFLTIVEPIQSILEEELDKACEKWNPHTVYAIMADPETGNILAMAQRPTFDPNVRGKAPSIAYRTRITEDVFEPGSIMKPITVAGALDSGVISPQTRVDCEQRVWFYRGRPLTDTHAYGMQDVTGVIRKSSNIGTAKIAITMGEKRLNDTLRKFGFGSYSGLPLRESRGIFPPLSRWDGLSISRFGMGYGVAVSPVQMLRAYCALANRGKLPKLRLVDRRRSPETGTVVVQPPETPQQLYRRAETGEEIVKMMVTVTEPGGTATRAAIPGYHVAGKTGTARKVVNGRYVTKYFASFVGFVPAEKPAFVLLVTFDEPKGSIYGGTVAGPVWRAIAERTLKYMDIKPDAKLLPPDKRSARRH